MKTIFTFLLFATITFFIKPVSVHAQAADAGDSLALVDLYNATNGPAWTNHAHWLSGRVNTWYGVSLDSNGRVTDLKVATNNLTGTLPASMGNLIKMQNLLLNANKLTGPVPVSFNNYTRILDLELQGNYFNFDGIESLNAATLSYTKFATQHKLPVHYNGGVLSVTAGGTPSNNTYIWIASGVKQPSTNDSTFKVAVAGVYYVQISNSKLGANFPLTSDTITAAPSVEPADSAVLVSFYQATNGDSWTDHTNWLTANPVSSWKGITLNSNGYVISINLTSNNLTGTLVSGLSKLTKLRELILTDNHIGGGIPGTFSNFATLFDLELSHNNLGGPLPNFKSAPIITYNLAYNQLTGVALVSGPAVKYVYLQHNHFAGGISNSNPLTIQVFDVTYNYLNFDGLEALTPSFRSLIQFQPQYSLPLHVNNYTLSATATGASRLGYTDFSWYKGSTLLQTTVGDSTFTVSGPGQYSVVVSDENLPAGFNLYSDTLSVSLVANTADSLALVDFYHKTNGPGWTNHTNWLTGPMLTWWGVKANENGRVTSINLQSNNLMDSIPVSFGSLDNLQYLNLSGNNLADSIPAAMGNLVKLWYLNLSSNMLTGHMPDSLTNLVNLLYLKLNDNQLNGIMPVNLGNIKGLDTIDLSNNNFEHGVPLSLNNLTAPAQINVTGNRLEFFNLPNLTNAVLSVLSFNDQQHFPVDFDSIGHGVSMVDFSHNIISSYGKVAWSLPPGNNPNDEDYDGSDAPPTWHVYTPGVFSWLAGYTVTITAAEKYMFHIYSVQRTITAAELPVKLTTFTGQLAHGQAYFNWQTASELNSSYFGVQRSIDGTNFTTVGKVAAAGTSAVTKNYQYTDALTGLATMPAALYYRLQQVDKDGKQSLSKTIVLNPAVSSSLIMYPNPVHGLLNVRVKDIPGNAVITITDAGGKTLLAQTAKTVTGGQTISLNTSRLAAGVYVVHVQYNGQSEEQKFVKE